MPVFTHPQFDDHQRIIFCRDARVGLRAIIAIHDTTLGPAAGGCRMWPYRTEDEALADVLRLSRAMTYKNSLAGLPLGGGKSVIIGDPWRDKSPALLRSFGTFVQGLAGQYWTAEDIGIDVNDVEGIAAGTQYVFGLANGGWKTGNPAPFTARGCYEAMRACLAHRLGRDDVRGLTVAVQGVGGVGFELCKLLCVAGAHLIVADPNEDQVARCVTSFNAQAVEPDAIYEQAADIFAPCAVGSIVNDSTVARLRVAIVCGAANNQLAEPRHARLLRNAGITYAPDYVVNADGMHNAAGDILGYYDARAVLEKLKGIGRLMTEILVRSEREDRDTSEIADEFARQRVEQGRAPTALC